jgi:TPP-dependent pyruvate/acetoin dehydrogenase alpha subunit
VVGDGVFDEGTTYEMFNLAALHGLPLLIICENNRYAAHTPIERRLARPLLAERAQVFGLPTEKLDGNDPELLRGVLERLIPDIRRGSGPRFVEIETYRFCGHVGPGDDEALGYRSRDEIEGWKARDPVLSLRRRLVTAFDPVELQNQEAEIEAQIATAIAAAKRAEFADFSTIMSSNWSGEYARCVNRFVHSPILTFEGGQPEARLGPF